MNEFKNLLNGHFLREKNSKSESNSEIYKFRSALFESSALKKCYVEFVKFFGSAFYRYSMYNGKIALPFCQNFNFSY